MWYYGSYTGSSQGNGTFRRAYDPLYYRNGRYQGFVDLCVFPSQQIPSLLIYFLSRVLDRYDRYAGGMFLSCAEAVYEAGKTENSIWTEVRAGMGLCL